MCDVHREVLLVHMYRSETASAIQMKAHLRLRGGYVMLHTQYR